MSGKLMFSTTVVRDRNGNDLVYVTDKEIGALRLMSVSAYMEYLRKTLKR